MKKYKKFIAHFRVESNTPLGIGAGKGGLVNDRLIARDANDLPYIPGTALAGIVRHELEDNGLFQDQINYFFGFQKGKEGHGSRIVFSSGLLLDKDGKTVLEGIRDINFDEEYFCFFKQMPERDHVRINHKGVAEKHGKYEEEILHKGTRFAFEIEMEGTDEDESIWNAVLQVLNSPSFRIGAGTRKGFGQLKVLSCHTNVFDLSEEKQLLNYLKMSASLNKNISTWLKYLDTSPQQTHWILYKVELQAKDFFQFGSGTLSEFADNTPKKEKYIDWSSGSPLLSESYLLPATSLKGTLSHRIAYHYNKNFNNRTVEAIATVDDLKSLDLEKALLEYSIGYDLYNLNLPLDSPLWAEIEAEIDALNTNQSGVWNEFEASILNSSNGDALKLIGEQNIAVAALFGSAKDGEKGARGKVIFSDTYFNIKANESKFFNHVAIDRFTGGARDGALFTQELISRTDQLTIQIYVHSSALDDPNIKYAWESALQDLIQGNLQLGGGTNKGHGVFIGQISHSQPNLTVHE